MSSLSKRVERDDIRDEQREKRKAALDADVAKIREEMQQEEREVLVGTASVELIRENADGSADYMFNFPPEAMEALTRLGIMTAIQAGLDKAKRYEPDEPVHDSDTSQERVDETGKNEHEWVGLSDEDIWRLRREGDGARRSQAQGEEHMTDAKKVQFLTTSAWLRGYAETLDEDRHRALIHKMNQAADLLCEVWDEYEAKLKVEND